MLYMLAYLHYKYFFWHIEMNNKIDSILLYKILQLQLGQ